MKVHQTDFSKGNVYRNIIEVSLPMTLAQLLNLLYNIVDRMYIGLGMAAVRSVQWNWDAEIMKKRKS